MENLIKTHRYYFLKVARRNLSDANKHWAEDILQEAFLRAFDNLESYDSKKGKPITWLTTILVNLCRDFHRKKANQEVKYDDFSKFDRPYESNAEELSTDIEAHLNLLSPRDEKIIRMRFFSNMTAKEIAPLVGVEAGSIPMITKRALKKLRILLDERGIRGAIAA